MSDTPTSAPNSTDYAVIIPFYRAYDFFEQSLTSVLGQTVPPNEVVIVDDEATERARQFLARFASDAVRIISLPCNSGAANARNVGISLVTTEWVAFQDADDIWEADKIERQFEHLHRSPHWAGCHTGVRVFGDDGVIKGTYLNKPHELRLDHLSRSGHVTPPSLLIRRSVLNELGGMDTRFTTSEDHEFSIRLVKAGHVMGFVPLPLIRVRRQGHGNVSANWHRTIINHVRLMRIHRDLFFRAGETRVARAFFAKSLMDSSGKLGGISGSCLYRIGLLLAPRSRHPAGYEPAEERLT